MAFNPYPAFGDVFTFDPRTGALKFAGNGSYSTGLLAGGSATPKTSAGPGYTQAQVDASLAANPNAAGMPGGSYPYFGGDLIGAAKNATGGNPGGIDWGAIIAGDPAYQQTLQDLQAANIGDQASRDAAIRRAIINFGQVPDLQAAQQALGFDLGPIVDSQTAQLAGQNAYSTEANLTHNQQLGIQKLRQQLAARGLLQSGELGYQLGEQNRAFGQAQNTATQNLLDALAGYQGQYTNAVNGRQQSATQALLDALTHAISLYGNSVSSGGGGGGGGAPAPSGGGTTSPSAPTAAPLTGSVAQNIQNYGIGQNPQQRVNFIGY